MAARGNVIVISANPQGKFLEGYVSGTPKPGTVMEVMTPFYRDGRHLWRAYQPGTDGEQRLIAVLREDNMQGKLITDAYVTLTRCFLYCPIPGEELNMLLADVSGTGDDHPAGQVLMVDTGTGKLIATTGSPESEPFVLLEAATDPTADFLAPCMFTGY